MSNSGLHALAPDSLQGPGVGELPVRTLLAPVSNDSKEQPVVCRPQQLVVFVAGGLGHAPVQQGLHRLCLEQANLESKW